MAISLRSAGLRLVQFIGFDPRPLSYRIRGFPTFVANGYLYARRNVDAHFPLKLRYLFPRYVDRYADAGVAKGHYFLQDLWAARKIFRNNPIEHVDVGSRIDGFVAHLLTFRSATVVDLRPLRSSVRGLMFKQGDITRLGFPDRSIESLSCLHAIEHIGLGRYGDEVDPDGWKKGLRELQRVVKEGGHLYLSTPVGTQRVFFDAHRVFAATTVIDTIDQLELVSFSYVDDAGDLHEGVEVATLPDLEYGCGLFEFVRPL